MWLTTRDLIWLTAKRGVRGINMIDDRDYVFGLVDLNETSGINNTI
jgi:hypothetical protein